MDFYSGTLECVGLLSHFTLFLRLTIPHICTPVQLENLCFSCIEYYNIYLSKNIWHNNCANVAKLGFHNQILRIQIGFFGPSFSSFFLIIWRSQVSAMDIFILHMAFYFSGFKQYLHQQCVSDFGSFSFDTFQQVFSKQSTKTSSNIVQLWQTIEMVILQGCIPIVIVRIKGFGILGKEILGNLRDDRCTCTCTLP